MSTKTLRGAVTLLLVGIASAGSAATETLQGNLGEDPKATDTFRLNCNLPDIEGARARVRDLDPSNMPAKMRVVLINCGVTCTDVQVDKSPTPHGELGSPSGWASRDNGFGIYNVYIFKTASGRETYKVQAACVERGGSSISPKSFTPCQNERPSMTPCP